MEAHQGKLNCCDIATEQVLLLEGGTQRLPGFEPRQEFHPETAGRPSLIQDEPLILFLHFDNHRAEKRMLSEAREVMVNDLFGFTKGRSHIARATTLAVNRGELIVNRSQQALGYGYLSPDSCDVQVVHVELQAY